MKTIALVGPFTEVTRETIKNLCEGFCLINVPSYEYYGDLKRADYIIIRTLQLRKRDLEGGHISFIQKWGAGYDRIDLEGISELDIPIAACSGINAEPVAEMAVLHMLALYRNFIAVNADLRRRIWNRDSYSNCSGTISGKTVGIIGMGNVGSRVAQIVQAFGARVVFHDFRTSLGKEKLGIRELSLDELLSVSDIVTVHIPLTDDSRGLFDSSKFALMKPSAIFINTARGELVQEYDLAWALKNGIIAGAGLDVFAQEPPDDTWPLYDLENVVYTPHAGGNTADNDDNMIRRCVDNLSRIESGRPLRRADLVNGDLLKTKIDVED